MLIIKFQNTWFNSIDIIEMNKLGFAQFYCFRRKSTFSMCFYIFKKEGSNKISMTNIHANKRNV